jgi:hypothetical protein
MLGRANVPLTGSNLRAGLVHVEWESNNLIEATLGAPGLETWVVGPDDSLQADADKING